jgi:threonine efflux protein
MKEIHPLVAVALLNLAAAVSPGPAFMLVSQSAALSKRNVAWATAFGTVAASVTWAAAALLGMQLLLARVAGLYRFLEIGGGLFLLFFGWSTWRDAAKPLSHSESNRRGTAAGGFRKGLLLGLSNPKVIVFFGTIFTTLFNSSTPTSVRWLALLVVFVNESLWYGGVATLFGAQSVRAFYARWKSSVERLFGGLFTIFGIRLVWDGSRFRWWAG